MNSREVKEIIENFRYNKGRFEKESVLESRKRRLPISRCSNRRFR